MKRYSVLFIKPEATRRYFMDEKLTPDDYQEIDSFDQSDVNFRMNINESIWEKCQNIETHWRPENPCRSMMVGDIIRDNRTGIMHIVANVGFEEFSF